MGYNSKWRGTKKRKTLKKRVSKLEKSLELKTHDSSQSSTVGLTMVLTHLSAMVQGVTSLTRLGLQICPVNIKVFGTLAQNGDATAPTVVRLMMVRDKEAHGGIDFTLPELLEGEDPTVRSLKEHDRTQRFTILWDKLIVLNERVSATSWAMPIKYFRKLGGVIHYVGTGATFASLGANNIYLVAISNDDTNKPTLNVNMRLRFTD